MTARPQSFPTEVERQAFRRLPRILRLALLRSEEYRAFKEEQDGKSDVPADSPGDN